EENAYHRHRADKSANKRRNSRPSGPLNLTRNNRNRVTMSQKFKTYPIEIDGSAMLSWPARLVSAIAAKLGVTLTGTGLTADRLFEERIIKLLSQIERRSRTGAAVLKALPTGKPLEILPYTPPSAAITAVCNASGSAGREDPH